LSTARIDGAAWLRFTRRSEECDVDFNEGADLDAGEIRDLRGVTGGIGGRVVAGGGGLGIVGVIIYLLLSQFGGGFGNLGGGFGLDRGLAGLGSGQQVTNSDLSSECRTGADAKRNHDCAIVAIVNSIQDYWSNAFARSGTTYRPATTTFFTDRVETACGAADSSIGPFYCPADEGVYLNLSFFEDVLQRRFGAEGGLFAEAYVLAHEYGHHVQNLLGRSSRINHNETGPTSGLVRLELQADCYAGVWAHNAATTPTESGEPLITNITQEDIRQALDAAQHIGDDYLQREFGGGRVDESQFSHGTSAQREKWLLTGLNTGDPAACDTFNTNDLG